MRSHLRFPFSAADQSRMSNIVVSETPLAKVLGSVDVYPQSMQIDFTGDPAQPPKALPLFGGQFGFNRTGPGQVPTPNQLITQPYSNFATRGGLWFRVGDPTAARRIAVELGGLHIAPNRVFLSPVQITEEFLFQTLVHDLPRRSFRYNGQYVSTKSSRWPDIAPAAFLAGDYWPRLREHSSDPDQDDVMRYDWPVVPLDDNGTGRLYVSTAVRRHRPDDIGRRDLGTVKWSDYFNLTITEPAHPAYGAIPARLVYDPLAHELVDGDPGLPVADAVRANPPSYRLVQFSRTWKPVGAESFWFPFLTARLQFLDGTEHEQRIPHHGVVWVPTPSPNQPIQVDISGEDGWSWLPGSIPDVWREQGQTAPVTLAGDEDHIVLRRPFAAELLTERVYRPGGSRCVYMTLRRFVRAYTENRITGGLLNHKWDDKRQAGKARWLHDQAFTGLGDQVKDGLVHNRPWHKADPTFGLGKLRGILEEFHPEMRGGTIGPARTTGEVYYDLWLSQYGKFHHDAMDGMDVGLGAAGAAEAMGFGELAYEPQRLSHESFDIWMSRLATKATTEIAVPAVLQFWDLHTDFVRMQQAGEPAGAFPDGETIDSYGHSLLVLRVDHDDDGPYLRILDQFGRGDVRLVSETFEVEGIGTASRWRLDWPGARRRPPDDRIGEDIWIAANIGSQLR